MAHGNQAGDALAGEGNKTLAEGDYAFGLALGFQPSNAGLLLGKTSDGTAQRFINLNAFPQDDDDDGEEEPPEPRVSCEEFRDFERLKAGAFNADDAARLREIGFDDEEIDKELWPAPVTVTCTREVRKAAVRMGKEIKKRVHAEADEENIDAHAVLNQLKVAALLAILHGRSEVDMDGWNVASAIWETSKRVHAGIMGADKVRGREEWKAKVEREARAGIITDERKESRKLDKAVAKAVRAFKKHGGIRTKSWINHRVGKDYLLALGRDAVIEALLDRVMIEEVDGGYKLTEKAAK